MSEGQYFRFGGFAAKIETSWERLEFETRDEPDRINNLESFFNGEEVRGDKDQTDFCFR